MIENQEMPVITHGVAWAVGGRALQQVVPACVSSSAARAPRDKCVWVGGNARTVGKRRPGGRGIRTALLRECMVAGLNPAFTHSNEGLTSTKTFIT